VVIVATVACPASCRVIASPYRPDSTYGTGSSLAGHWVKDVVLGEDTASIKQDAPANLMAILRNLALSLFRANGYPSIVTAIDRLGNDFDQLFPMLGLSFA
jgi:hypothetical protein